MGKLTGKRAIITRDASGIGKAMALLFAQGGGAIFIRCDVLKQKIAVMQWKKR
jgi:NAD(P)-dependent dehydrogenase (short-subunit alcohol dehydrogenase family)